MSILTNKTDFASRQETRYNPQLCELSMNYEGSTEEIAIRLPDLSPHGMFINTTKTLPYGAVLKLKFRLACTGVVIQARGEVRYCLEGVGVGVEFIDLASEALSAITEEISIPLPKK